MEVHAQWHRCSVPKFIQPDSLCEEFTMTKLIELSLGLTDKLMGSLLDWPFLLFVAVAWVLTRYRDQIGSMLDRRGAVGAGVVIGAVRREMQPVLVQVEGLAKAVSDLRYEVERLQALHSENRLSRVLEPVTLRIKSLEEAIARTQAETEKVVRKDVPEALNQERSAIRAEIDEIRKVLDQYAARLKTLASQDAVDRTGADVKAAQAALDAVAQTVQGLQSSTEKLATKEAANELRSSLAELEAATRSLPGQMEDKLQKELQSLRWDLSAAQESVSRLASGLERAATKDVTDRLQAEMAPLVSELAKLRDSIAQVDASIAATAQELRARVTAEVAPLNQNVSTRIESSMSPLASGLDELKASVGALEAKLLAGPKELELRFTQDLGRISQDVAALKEALGEIKTQAQAVQAPEPVVPSKGGKPDVLAALKKALTTSGKAGRRIDALAKMAGISEAQALELLAASAEFTLDTNSKGQQTARLARK
jgi:hypothetical protein